MIIYEIIDDTDGDLLSLATMANGQEVVLALSPTELPYKQTDVTLADLNDEKFKVTLHGVESVTDDTEEKDVLVFCPPDKNSHGRFLIIVHDIIRCQTVPGFPDVKGKPKIKINNKKQKISVTLEKATQGSWITTWNNLRKKQR